MGDVVLSWPSAATEWVEAAPVGNGRIGAMVLGDRIQVNDSTVWSGTPDQPAAGLAAVVAAGAGPARLAEVRKAVWDKDFRRAEELLTTFQGRYSQEFLPFAELTFLGARTPGPRTLNLDTGVVRDECTVDGVAVERHVWVSHPAQALCVTLESECPIDLTLALDSPLRVVHRAGLILGVEIPIDGAPQHEPQVPEPLRYGTVDGYDPFGAVAVRIDTDGRLDTDAGVITGMTRALVVLATATAAADWWFGRPIRDRQEYLAEASATAGRAVELGGAPLLAQHEADMRELLGGTSLRIGTHTGEVPVADVLSGVDSGLVATVMCQLGRYLLASSSRPGSGPPANLQGVWNADVRPPWSSNYTVNINTQMNYWPAEPAGLPDCHLPLVDLVEKLAVTGADVARELYGARGWVTHHNTDMWGWALPVGMGHGNPSWANWQMGGAWLVQHVWDHYEFTGDVEFLRVRGWPLLRGCAEFCLDWLVEGPDGHLDTVPSTSPENLFLADGEPRSVTCSSTMDITLIGAVLTRCLQAMAALDLDDPIGAEIAGALPRLRRTPVTEGGQLGEWAEDLPEADPHHRHLSPLIGLYPLGETELSDAATRLLDRRGPGAMGWSWAWKIALRARLRDGEAAYALFQEATRPYDGDPHDDAPVDGSRWGGLLPNLLSTHPPCQLDGNYGFTAALLEMVVQSHHGIHLLPALPRAWPDGEVTGVRCRGWLAVDVSWRDGHLVSAVVRRLTDGRGETVPVRYRELATELKPVAGEEIRLDGTLTPMLSESREQQ